VLCVLCQQPDYRYLISYHEVVKADEFLGTRNVLLDFESDSDAWIFLVWRCKDALNVCSVVTCCWKFQCHRACIAVGKACVGNPCCWHKSERSFLVVVCILLSAFWLNVFLFSIRYRVKKQTDGQSEQLSYSCCCWALKAFPFVKLRFIDNIADLIFLFLYMVEKNWDLWIVCFGILTYIISRQLEGSRSSAFTLSFRSRFSYSLWADIAVRTSQWVSRWVGFNGTSTGFRSLAPSLTRKAGSWSPLQ